jgi:hypothetical protein
MFCVLATGGEAPAKRDGTYGGGHLAPSARPPAVGATERCPEGTAEWRPAAIASEALLRVWAAAG